MTHCTPVTEVRARKRHSCSWCAQRIERGEVHRQYTYIGEDGPCRVRLHQECYAAFQAYEKIEQGGFEFSPGDFTRGCTCEGGDCGHGTYATCLKVPPLVVIAA